jgi:hypothetical protein
MPSKLSTFAAAVALGMLTSLAFAAESENQQDGGPWLGFDFVVPDTHTTCLEGIGTIECTSTRLNPDPEDCPPGESLIKIRRFGILSRVCAPGSN